MKTSDVRAIFAALRPRQVATAARHRGIRTNRQQFLSSSTIHFDEQRKLGTFHRRTLWL
jgi:hypothetical protein